MTTLHQLLSPDTAPPCVAITVALIGLAAVCHMFRIVRRWRSRGQSEEITTKKNLTIFRP